MIRVLIVEDSATMAELLRAAIDGEPDMKVVGLASDGEQAVAMARDCNPDVITMDVELPRKDGIQATREIMMSKPVPIIVVSAYVDNADMRIGFRALEEGALAVLAKPQGVLRDDVSVAAREILRAIRIYNGTRLITRRARRGRTSADNAPASYGVRVRSDKEIVALAASTGGPPALRTILADLPSSFDVPVAITIHMSKDFLPGFAVWLDELLERPVGLARNNQPLERGCVYLAPGDHHLLLARGDDNKLVWRLDRSDPVNGFRPSATPFLQSVADISGHRAVGGILTGMGSDGADGLLSLREAGGETFAQDQATSVIFGMPGVALANGAAKRAVPLNRIAAYIVRSCTAYPRATFPA